MTGIIRFHLSLVLCFFVNDSYFMDLIFPIIVNVVLSLGSGNLYQYISTHKQQYEILAEYFITNYTKENFIIWKRIALLIVFSYIMLAVAFVTIDNYMILLSTIQSLISFIICDLIEHRTKLYKHFSCSS